MEHLRLTIDGAKIVKEILESGPAIWSEKRPFYP